jgi:hypothetical protein
MFWVLIPKIPSLWFAKEHSKTPIEFKLHKLIFLFLRFNHRILLWTIKIMCEKNFKKVDHIVCKIITFEVKKGAFFTPCKIGSTNFESSWPNTLALHKLEAFDIVLEN